MKALESLRRGRSLDAKTEAEARQNVDLGYQIALSYEGPRGGFAWYGQKEPDLALTAMALAMFSDMEKVRVIDASMIDRSRDFLLQGLDRKEVSPALLGFAIQVLAAGGVNPARLEESLSRARKESARADDSYDLAHLAAGLLTACPDAPETAAVLLKLEKAARPDPANGLSRWTTSAESLFHASGDTADIETTAVAATVLLRKDPSNATATQALAWLATRRGPDGTWGSTAATIAALDAFLQADGSTPTVACEAVVRLNDIERRAALPAGDDGVTRRIEFDDTKVLQPGPLEVEISATAPCGALAQLVVECRRPWSACAAATPKRRLTLSVRDSLEKLKVGETLVRRATLKFDGSRDSFMTCLEVGVPPGFVADLFALEGLVSAETIDRFEIGPRSVVLYLGAAKSGSETAIEIPMRARLAMKGRIPSSSAWEYYTPESRDTVPPASVEVTAE